MGIDCDELINKGRRLILKVNDYEVVLAKAADVITYVEHGVCDIGIVEECIGVVALDECFAAGQRHQSHQSGQTNCQ